MLFFILKDKIVDVILRYDPDSRLAYYLSNGGFFDAEGRNEYYTYLLSIIKKNYLAINGLFSDRLLLQTEFGEITYAHNILLEFVIDYGIVFGFIFATILIWKLIKYFISKKHDIYSMIFILIFIPKGIMLLFSGSYLTCADFFVLLAILFLRKQENDNNMLLREKSESADSLKII